MRARPVADGSMLRSRSRAGGRMLRACVCAWIAGQAAVGAPMGSGHVLPSGSLERGNARMLTSEHAGMELKAACEGQSPALVGHPSDARRLRGVGEEVWRQSYGHPVDPVALRLAVTDLKETFGARYGRADEFLSRLGGIEARLSDPAKAEAVQRELAVLAGEALRANPLLDEDRLLVLRRGFPQPAAAREAMGQDLGVGSLNAHTSDDTPRQGRWQDELVLLSGLRAAPQGTRVYRPPDGETVIDPVLHFDARRLLFARNGVEEKNWRLWEIRLDGQGLRQVTPDDGVDVAHFDPCYLPDDRVLFASTAVYQGLPCEFGAQAMVCLYLLDPRAGSIRQLTFEQDSDWCPTVLPNGRVLYLRWEYTDQSHANSRILFHMNPDGTDQREFRGSGSWFPGSFFYAKPVPGHPTRVIGVAGGHHGTPRSGRLLLLDAALGRRDGEGIIQEIPGRGRKVEPIVRDRLVDGVWPQFLMPWPLSAKYYLVAAKPRPNALWGIYLVDVFDNLTLLREEEGAALLWPIWVRPEPPPPVIQDRVKLETSEATVFITDVNEGPGLHGVPRGTVKRLRVIEYYFARRGFGGLYGTLGMDGPWDIKRVLGTVPVEPDGSAHFRIPANTPLSLQPLDDRGQALQLMRSWFVGMPGEAVSCGGCHEPQHEVSANRPTLAARSPPRAIEPWHGPARGFSFPREVQPVLDRYCVPCHDGRQTDRPRFDGGEMLNDWSSQLAGRWEGGGKFSRAYYELQRFVRRPGIEGDRRMFTPLDYHFRTTELGQLLGAGHHGVRLDAEAWERLATWVDLNAPYFGRWGEIPQFSDDPVGAARLARVNARAMELRRAYVPMGPHPDYEAAPAGECAVVQPVPSPAGPEGGLPPAPPAGWSFDSAAAVGKQRAEAPPGGTDLRLALGEGVTLDLVYIPGGRLVMGSASCAGETAPPLQVEVSPFWMARTEISNRQFRRFQPLHESRTEDRLGYQFGVVGYDQDQPQQPAVRVSWEEAMAFCRWISDCTGRRVTLPSEVEWEWACRGGSAGPFWFGDFDTDFAAYANLGDRRLQEFAADTALDNYSRALPMTNPNRYDAWIPREDRFDDGGLVTMPVGSYRPNPWGLHDMHGNAWEWTRSRYRPNAFDACWVEPAAEPVRGEEWVVRGGSWYDRPKRCTASARLGYPSWQRVYNVGFRVVIPVPAAVLAGP